jgi:four helix bundle protein
MEVIQKIKTHKDLEVWKNSMDLVTLVYQVSANIPKEEQFGLISQIKRSVVSVPSNIAEGYGRAHTNELIQFLNISKGSLVELDTQLLICLNLGFLPINDVNPLLDKINKIKSQLINLIKALKQKNN